MTDPELSTELSQVTKLIRTLSAEETLAQIDALAEVLLDVVAGGSSVSFMADFSHAEAVAYWRRIADEVAAGRRLLFVAGEGEKLYLSCGCVKVGEIPGYALMPDGRPAPTSIFYKRLDIR